MIGFDVDFALLLYDEFSGAPITDGGVMFFLNGTQIVPLKKPDGHFVFGPLPGDAPTLTIKRPRYLDARVTVEKLKLPRESPVQPVRLMRQYAAGWRDCIWLTGQCKQPGSPVLARAVKPAFQLKAAKKEDGANIITIFGGGSAALVGKRFAPEKGNDTFIIQRMLSLNDYLTDVLPEHGSGAKPFARAYLSQSGEDGHYYIPADECPEGIPDKAACYDAGKKKWVTVPAQRYLG